MKTSLAAIVVALAFAMPACDRTHLGRDFGTGVRAAQANQVVDSKAGTTPGLLGQGLDPQEAAIVLESYRKSLSPQGTDDAARRQPMMVVQPPQPQPPAPR